MLIARGTHGVGGRDVATLGPGQFAGEMSFLTGEPTTAAVEVLEPVSFVSWPTAELERCLAKPPYCARRCSSSSDATLRRSCETAERSRPRPGLIGFSSQLTPFDCQHRMPATYGRFVWAPHPGPVV